MNIDFTGEDFEQHWCHIDCKNKVVLDLGADFGSTAKCFLAKGAKAVIPVEGDANLYHRLKLSYPNAEMCFVDSTAKMKELLEKHEADIVKVDIELGEIWLQTQTDELLRKFKEWMIEGHKWVITELLIERFAKAGFSLIKRFGLNEDINVFFMVRKDRYGNWTWQ